MDGNDYIGKAKLHRESKKGAILNVAITLSFLDGFAKFLHCCKEHKIIVLLWIPKSTPNPRIFPESVRRQNLGFFATVSDAFGSSVRETVFTYQVAVSKRRCITQQPSSSYLQLWSSGRMGAAVELWLLEWWAAGGAMLSISYRQGICPTCMVHVALRNKPSRC